MAFLPYESKVFTLDYPQAFSEFYTHGSVGKHELAERIADQVATVCAMLGEYPAVRYRGCVSVCVCGGGGCMCVGVGACVREIISLSPHAVMLITWWKLQKQFKLDWMLTKLTRGILER